jgi:hypothetical protein
MGFIQRDIANVGNDISPLRARVGHIDAPVILITSKIV